MQHEKLLVILWLLTGLVASAAAGAPAPGHTTPDLPFIVNGVEIQDSPATVALWYRGPSRAGCTGTLVGCRTVLTAAHCVCEGTGADCRQDGPDLLPAHQLEVFSQSGGFVGVERIDVPPHYEFRVGGDVAVLHLEEPMEGVRPVPINELESPALGLSGVITGWGLTHGDASDTGLLRSGRVTIGPCGAAPEASHVCWTYEDPIGTPGDDSNTCKGDSGGPLFVDFGSGATVAGVTSGGPSTNCLQTDNSFDADVFVESGWIRTVAESDLDQRVCGVLPAVPGPGADLRMVSGRLSHSESETFTFEVGSEVEAVRITLNGDQETVDQRNDFDLYADFEEAPDATLSSDDPCRSTRVGTLESCWLEDPEPGTWFVTANAFSGPNGGPFQATVTLFGQASSGCVPSSTVFCAGEGGRFRVSVEWQDFAGVVGDGRVLDIGRRDSGIFWFFSPENLEMLVKVLDGCGVNDHFWVFAAATTTVRYTLTVTDLSTGEVAVYENPLGVAPPAITDTGAFGCS